MSEKAGTRLALEVSLIPSLLTKEGHLPLRKNIQLRLHVEILGVRMLVKGMLPSNLVVKMQGYQELSSAELIN